MSNRQVLSTFIVIILYIWNSFYLFILYFSLPLLFIWFFLVSWFMLEDKAFFLYLYFYSALETMAYMSIFLVVIFKFSAPTITFIYIFLPNSKVIQHPWLPTMQDKILECSATHWVSTSYFPCYCLELSSYFQYNRICVLCWVPAIVFTSSFLGASDFSQIQLHAVS